MRKLFYLTVLFITAASVPAAPLPLADPFILLHEGTYYAYGTHSNNGIEVYTSKDLINWQYAALALKKGDVWGKKWFWAPEVYKTADGGFLMYYSAEEHICAARSTSPLGPFTQKVKKPMYTQGKAIDHTLFIDTDGKARIYFSRFMRGLEIWTAEVESDLVTIKESTLKLCIKPQQPWERKQGSVNEGAFVLKHNGKYYLTYSGNGYTSQLYGIGCAVADSPEGPWRKDERNPLLQKPGTLHGTGHHSFFIDINGKLKVAFHAHRDEKNIHPRAMYITDAEFKDDKLHISKDYTPARLQK